MRLQGIPPGLQHRFRSCNGEDLFVHALHDNKAELTKEVNRNGGDGVPDDEAYRKPQARYRRLGSVSTVGSINQPVGRYVDELVRVYNERFNCYVRPAYDGSAQTFLA